MKFCTKCLHSNEDGANYCGHCGAPFVAPAPTAAPDPTPPVAPSSVESPPAPLVAPPSVAPPPAIGSSEVAVDYAPALTAPRSYRILGIVSICFAVLTILFNIVAPLLSLSMLWDNVGAEAMLWAIPAFMFVAIVHNAMLLIGGIGMARGKPRGRFWAFIYAALALPVGLLTIVAAKVLSAMVEVNGGVQHPTEVVFGGNCCSPLFAAVLAIMLLTGPTKAWLDDLKARRFAGVPGAAPGTAPIHRPNSVLAIICLVISPIPLMLLPQLTAIILGIIALRRIRRSNGQLGGKWFAIIGIIIASTFFAIIGGIVLLVLVIMSLHPH